MSKTVKELADDLGVSKQTIQYHYQRLPTSKRQKDKQGRNVISPYSERLIRDKVAKNSSPNNHQKDRQISPNSDKKNDAVIASMKDEITYLRADRDKQFAAKDQQIDTLQKLLDQSQQLQLMAEQKLKQLEKPKNEPESHPKAKDEQTNAEISEVSKTAENSTKQPLTFWQRLFGTRNNK
ncbi:DUF536 domain-containing protein [Lacticaseibacillus paracasei]|jgi:DNA-binding transcriptional regulator YhcF (GntR family)|uniref:DUF536 domain-containing protein n=1 Tax=Lactobacillaceae TaxID=33958 RepID=UPI0026471E62|nr:MULTISPECIES: DUF536 domain-containing protein [Lactobacillaceae]MDN6022466.1 helix-turn-helix domain-containing protein [Lactobacillus sp.]MDN6208415.1 helix-turn-helix domain-containing protein [Lactococcus sp.]MDN6437102.1 helix-turn-helix domain-containing protein [Lactococcus sp.]MDN6787980.1 helix-turn-helix domain-containing protein [Lentilactobacillus parabuchneri]MDP4467253.1 DUF536 domain-containing protein [Lacticaseibacillus paracasei]